MQIIKFSYSEWHMYILLLPFTHAANIKILNIRKVSNIAPVPAPLPLFGKRKMKSGNRCLKCAHVLSIRKL